MVRSLAYFAAVAVVALAVLSASAEAAKKKHKKKAGGRGHGIPRVQEVLLRLRAGQKPAPSTVKFSITPNIAGPDAKTCNTKSLQAYVYDSAYHAEDLADCYMLKALNAEVTLKIENTGKNQLHVTAVYLIFYGGKATLCNLQGDFIDLLPGQSESLECVY